MKPLFLCYPKCSTCAKASKWLTANGIDFTTRDIVADNPDENELYEWIRKSGLPVRKFFNTSGQSYRNQNLKDHIGALSDNQLILLLSSDRKLVKRPLLVADGFVLSGFREEEWKEKFL